MLLIWHWCCCDASEDDSAMMLMKMAMVLMRRTKPTKTMMLRCSCYWPFFLLTVFLRLMTHIARIRGIFDVANSQRYRAGFAPMLFQWSHAHIARFFVGEKSRDKKGSRAKKSRDKKFALCVSWHLVLFLLSYPQIPHLHLLPYLAKPARVPWIHF